MSDFIDRTPVKGGAVLRDAKTGKLLAVETDDGISEASEESRTAVQEASKRRAAALQRLADR